MAYKFFNIGKANARVDELEVELAAAKASPAADATKIAELTASNAEISTLLEKANADLSTANATSQKLQADHNAAGLQHDEIVARLTASVAAKSAELAVKIQAATGSPAAPVVPKSAAAPSTLTGMARVRAAAAADLLAAGYQKKGG